MTNAIRTTNLVIVALALAVITGRRAGYDGGHVYLLDDDDDDDGVDNERNFFPRSSTLPPSARRATLPLECWLT